MSTEHKARFGGGHSTHEAYLESKRDAIRRAMKNVYLKKTFDPSRTPGMPFYDAAILRFASAHYTRADFFYPTIKNVSVFTGMVVAPVALMTYFYFKEHNAKFEAIQRGENHYHSLDRFYKRYYY